MPVGCGLLLSGFGAEPRALSVEKNVVQPDCDRMSRNKWFLHAGVTVIPVQYTPTRPRSATLSFAVAF